MALIATLRALGRPLHLDLFCCQGGASKGYADAGFTVLGVDIDPQPRYVHPDQFVQADAVEFVHRYGHLFNSASASPPCQLYSKTHRIQKNDHPDLIGPTRKALEETGLPWVIENVMDAASELRTPRMLCGAMFGIETYRHRLFEPGGGFSFVPPEHPQHVARTTKMGRPVKPGEYMHVVGNFTGVDLARDVMGMPWANRDGLREAIPPAYTEWIGERLMAHVMGDEMREAA
ncbi:DNA cytosine methyltransferase [Streptomyces nitrosporeus]|uniref:DNA cytosine methyltransferase n=1 Tax=Streptomyces nitrosporeus TaxID=28894 RepID=A0A5J6FLS9_9ACTN|nr:DNA cytosine methyltransferase [Streptomyces nitrosporeus]QEU76881.1 DNA cytosine methyltransferase [Streptomyces nitrosporeus]